MNNIILGAGITGLAAGYKTGYTIYEATDVAGGLCRSYNKDGYRFEVGGGHWIFGDSEMVEFINRLSTVKAYKKDSGIYFNVICPAPVQSYANIEEYRTEGNMKDWLRNKFGNHLCRLFFYPFNYKYTCGLYDSIVQDDPKKSPSIKGKEYNQSFHYPKEGLNHLVDVMAKECDIKYRKKAISIDLINKTVKFSDGEIVEYDKLITTIPLKDTLEMAGIESDDLLYTSVFVLNIGATKGKYLPKEHWLYVPFCKNEFFRVGFYSNVEPTFAPLNKVSIYVERSLTNGTVELSYMTDVVNELKRWGWIEDVDVMDIKRIKYAYTWKTKKTNVNRHLKELKKYDIISTGRYGSWKFCGISESIEMGLSV